LNAVLFIVVGGVDQPDLRFERAEGHDIKTNPCYRDFFILFPEGKEVGVFLINGEPLIASVGSKSL